MVIRNEIPKNTAKDFSPKSSSAFKNGKGSGLSGGGVWGKRKETSPRTAERKAANNSGRLLTGSPGFKSTFWNKLAAIQPMVPRTRMVGKSLWASGMLAKI